MRNDINDIAERSGWPPGLAEWVESSVGGRILNATTRAGGGETRGGASVTIERGDGNSLECYLCYDVRLRDDANREVLFEREASVLQALQETGVKVPKLLAFSREQRAFLCQWVDGDSRYSNLSGEAVRRSVAFDYMQQLARLHRIDPSKCNLEMFGSFGTAADGLRQSIDVLEATHLEGEVDPLIIFILRWLRKNMPDYTTPLCIVHGDAGPGNFLHDGQQVTAVLDWELVHLGDPMEDLAWVCFRDLIQPFYSLAECFAEYERAGGPPVDIERVLYYRVYIQATVIVDVFRNVFQSTGAYPASLGNVLIYYTLHLRTIIEGLASLVGIELRSVSLPGRRLDAKERFYDLALEELRSFVLPHLENEAAMHRAKGLARLIKYWRGERGLGGAFEAAEIDEIASAVGARSETVAEARAVLVQRLLDGLIDDETALNLLYGRAVRENELMRSSMGALADRRYSALE